MLLEEVLAGHREGQNVRRSCWDRGVYLDEHSSLTYIATNADDWELSPKTPVVIDLVKYADGYEFEYSEENCFIDIDSKKMYGTGAEFVYKSLGVTYMTEKKAHELANKLNSGEGVLK